MTSKDKTADQLVASIRKSKTGTVAQKNPARRTAKKTPARGAAMPAAATPGKTAARTPARATGSETGSGVYSHGRRVWPD
jgi:hypothetical protein